MKIINEYTKENILALLKHANRLVYGFNTCYWKIGDPVYNDEKGIPCGHRGEMLFETDDPIGFYNASVKNPKLKHGEQTFVAAFHGNLVNDAGLPTCFETWEEYDNLIDALGELE